MSSFDQDLVALQEMRDAVAASKKAVKQLSDWDQARVDALCKALVVAASDAAYELARHAVEETGIGRVHYKVLKNVFASEGIWEDIRSERTVGILGHDERTGVTEIGTASGVIACIVPTTNPTSTAIGKALIAIKGRNAAVISPHPRAKGCIAATVDVLREAIRRAGGPPDLVTVLRNPTIESTGALMKHRDVAMILATGGSGLVHAAYSSGKPAYGVGPGNVPLYIDRSADVEKAAKWIVASQSFDNATLCCSEQALVVDRPALEQLLAELQRRGAHLANAAERKLLEDYCNKDGMQNPDIVGLDPWKIAAGAGISVPKETTLLLAFQDGVGKCSPLSIEILCPLLSVHVVDGWEEGCDVSMKVLHNHGLGHTCGVWAQDESVLEAWALQKPASRIIVNGPTSQGSVGYSTGLTPSMSLGCGTLAGNITSDNITARHLLNVKRLARPTKDWEERYARDMERAAAATGDRAPRGSGLQGDPGLGAGRSGSGGAGAPGLGAGFSRSVPSLGSPAPSAAPRMPAAAPAPAATPRPAAGSAPRFTDGLASSAPRPAAASQPPTLRPAPAPS
ncbi:MAG: aldehyde dehydrogenase family protein, partial [Planctomycetota bacterium]|nr:aldehyde dehydrogenase family protein [Planctomycetota bacterium]